MSPILAPLSDHSMNAPKPPRNLRYWLSRMALLGVTCLVCLVLLEIAVRVFLPWYNPSTQLSLQRNEAGIVIGPSNTLFRQGAQKGDFLITVRFNRHGFRDTKDYAQATANDVFVIGDSYSMGWGVEEHERYGNLLEERFGARFYNFCLAEDIRGYARTLQYVERQGTPIRHLVIGLCMENDLWDYSSITNTHAVYQTHMVSTFRQNVAAWFRKRSALWNFCSHTLQKMPVIRQFFEKIGISRNIDQLTHKNEATPEILRSSRDELVRFATNYNAVVLIVPSRALWAGKNVETERKVHEHFTSMLRDAGLDLVDMKPIQEKSGDPGSFYFKTDPHWNPCGQALAAQALADYFARSEKWKWIMAGATNRPAAPSP